MNKVIKTLVITIALFLITPEKTHAQGPPPWAPAHGYRAKTKHIYFPEQNIYYDIEAHNYIYLDGGHWSISAAIPRPFININFGLAPKIQLDYVGHNPYRYNEVHIVKYKGRKPVKVKARKHKVHVIDGHHDGHGHGKGNKHK